MKSKVERLPGSRVVLDVEVPPEEMQADIDQTCRRLARQVRIPGFRPGRAPAPVLERVLGRPRVLQEALDPMVSRAYQAALAEHGVRPVEQPQVDVKTFEDGQALHFTATVTARPEVRLCDWSGLSVGVEPDAVSPEAIEAALGEIQQAHANWVPSEEPARVGDMVILRTTGRVEGGPRIDERRVEGVLGTGRLRPEIEAAVTGKTPGASEELDLAFAADDHTRELAGKTARVRVELLEVKRRELAPLDDAFAAEVSERQTLEELRADLGNTLRRAALERARQAALDEAVRQVVDGSEMDLPEILVERMLDSFVGDIDRRASGVGDSLQAQLSREGRTLESLRADLRPSAERSIRTQLVLDAVAERFDLQPTTAELDEEIARLARVNGVDLATFREVALRSDNLSTLRAELTRAKAARRLRDDIVRPDPEGAGDAAAEGTAAGA